MILNSGMNKLSDSKLSIPLGLTLDIHARRVFWTDRSELIFFLFYLILSQKAEYLETVD